MKRLWIVLPAVFLLMISAGCSGVSKKGGKGASAGRANKFSAALRISENTIDTTLSVKATEIKASDVIIYEYGTKVPLKVVSATLDKAGKKVTIVTDPMDISKNYLVNLVSFDQPSGKWKTNAIEAQWGDQLLNSFSSDKKMGMSVEGKAFTFRVFSPRATKVLFCLFDKPYTDDVSKPVQDGEKQMEMTKDKDGVWEITLKEKLWGKYYGYRVDGPKGGTEMFDPKILVADPYSVAVTTREVAPQVQLSVIIDASTYKWKSEKKHMGYKQEEIIVYEMHVRDMTMMSKDIKNKGTYKGLTEDGKQGGLVHIKDLGVNAVELEPTQEFDEVELPYMGKTMPVNTWNAYGRNHWGYMTSCFFAPESFYYEGKIVSNAWIGADGGQVFAFKEMVDTFHQNGIAVMMDVVYNHVSQYDRNALKYIDKKYYFWINATGGDDSKSGCGNDYKTDRPMSRRIVVDSTEYWVKEYNIDGYRFDLGTIIDWETYRQLQEKVYAINPNTFIVCEPWMGGRGEPRDGGGYSPEGMAKHNLGAWNDKVRDPIKAWAVGTGSTGSMKDGVKAFPGTFIIPKNSLSYMESHDNPTMADKWRKDLGLIKEKEEIMPDQYIAKATLSEFELKAHKIAILYLSTIQGSIMLHEGMEFARMKVAYPASGESVYPPNSTKWEKVGTAWKDTLSPKQNGWPQNAAPYTLDGNSYEKDNECNWLNWDLKDANIDLFKYYKGMVALRRAYPNAFGLFPIDKIVFIDTKVNGAFGYMYDKAVSGYDRSFLVIANGDKAKPATFTLPAGEWTVIVDPVSSPAKESKMSGDVEVAPTSGYILYQK